MQSRVNTPAGYVATLQTQMRQAVLADALANQRMMKAE